MDKKVLFRRFPSQADFLNVSGLFLISLFDFVKMELLEFFSQGKILSFPTKCHN